MWLSLKLKGHEGEIFVFLLSLKLCFSFIVTFLGMMCANPVVTGGGDSIIIIIYMGWRSQDWIQLLGGQGACKCIIFFLCECIWTVPVVSLSFQFLTIMGSWVLLFIGLSIPLVPPWVTGSHFLAGTRETELKPTTFSLLLLFHVFLSPLLLTLQQYIVPLIAACCSCSLIIINIYLFNKE